MFVLTERSIERLKQISNLRRHYADQLDGMASECCALFRVDCDHSYEADLARSIVDHVADVDSVVAKMMIAKANRELDEASQ